MASAMLVGSTGVVGSKILSTLSSLPEITSITSITRRAPSSTSTKLNSIVEADSTKWSPNLTSLTPQPSIFFSALGTTRAAAGGITNQRKIDVDLNYELATAAHAAGIKTCVLISSNGANAQSMLPYAAMKGELEEKMTALGFEHLVIIRPGFILGERPESRWMESAAKSIIGFMPRFAKNKIGQDKEVIARAAVAAGLQAHAGEVKDMVWILGGDDILRLGQAEWKA